MTLTIAASPDQTPADFAGLVIVTVPDPLNVGQQANALVLDSSGSLQLRLFDPQATVNIGDGINNRQTAFFAVGAGFAQDGTVYGKGISVDAHGALKIALGIQNDPGGPPFWIGGADATDPTFAVNRDGSVVLGVNDGGSSVDALQILWPHNTANTRTPMMRATATGDFRIEDPANLGSGLVLKSRDGNFHRVSVANDGSLSTTPV